LETKAHFVLIGAFTIAGLLGILGFFLWFAQVELDRQFDYYDIRFSSVSGLGNASDVRFSGLPVGQVVDVRLNPNMDGTILVRVEVDAETPVRTDSVATIEAQGVTGVSFVGIDPGTHEAELLEPTTDVPIPEIRAGRSTLQSLSEDAPRLLQQSLDVVEELSELLGAENRDRLNRILANVETASEGFAKTLEDFSAVATTVSDFADQINRFNVTLDTLTGDLTGVLETANTTLVSIGELSEQGKDVLTAGSDTLTAARDIITRTEQYVTDDLSLTTEELRQVATELRLQVTELGDDARALMATLGTTGETATSRLQDARNTLAAADALIARLDETAIVVGGAATGFDTLVREQATPLLSETRKMVSDADRAIASVTTIADQDLPVIISDIRAAAETFRTVTTAVGENLTASSQSVVDVLETAQGTLEDASVTFANANQTLSAINAALETGDRALSAAEKAFSGADRVINEDLNGLITGLESTIDSLDTAISQVSDDLPEMSADLRAASQAAFDTFAELRRLTDDSSPAIREFTTIALPLYSRLAQESRSLIANLDRLTDQITRDPTRFFLDRETPEFRR
jgi:phospholipid/cholesterol/gamma-HCH transport system substrate-binding protein